MSHHPSLSAHSRAGLESSARSLSSPHPVERWTPPLTNAGLARVIFALRGVRPLEEILDDIGDVLSNQEPREGEFGDLAARLHADVARLVTIAGAFPAADDVQTPRMVERARTLAAEELPTDHRSAVGHLRRLAGAANELLERLAEIRAVKEVA
ncbi:DUF6415 family natural product biosynthesis protein (plasmid) [Streptomyces niveus]|uniref:DUF6415 family natural product biosynthesis protein n=1 Tax=Streptomyces niveus TaxID=193462 RepID=UPI002E340E23|nr:DUF6415 family natural product biosynthesis protein [Streptomyces niveus]